VILHFHGGAYVIGSAKGSIEYASRLATAISGTCISVDYRLAPENPYPAAIDDAINAYRGLLESGVSSQRIILSGESSGGGLVIALAIAIRNAGFDVPAGILSICPFVDLTLKSESLRKFHGDDPAANIDLLSYLAASYFQGHEPTDPMVSPLFDDLNHLPPIFMAAATNEVLYNDATRLADKAKKAGNQISFKLVDDSVHVFTIFPFLPETQETLNEFTQWTKTIYQPSTIGAVL
jgi:salicylate hydroxylase